MARKRTEEKTWSASQVVAHNLTKARELRGLTQTEIAERLSRLTGTTWTQATVAQAEGSVTGTRVRQFSANELVALARTFDLPVLYFFLPPADGTRAFETADAPAKGWPWEYLLLLVWGHAKNFPAVADRAAPWAHASTIVTVPADDVLGPRPEGALLAALTRDRERYTPEDMLAVAFNGLARRRVRGALAAEDDVSSVVESLRGIADTLEAFANRRPGTFFDPGDVKALGERAKDQHGRENT